MKCFIIPVIIGATGTVTTRLKSIYKQYQDSIQQIRYKKKSRTRDIALVQEENYQGKGNP